MDPNQLYRDRLMHQRAGVGLTLRCVVPGCPWASEARIFTCLDHWRRVPSTLQNQLWIAYKAHPSGAPSKPQLLKDGDYVSAAVDVLDHIASMDGTKAFGIFHTAAKAISAETESVL